MIYQIFYTENYNKIAKKFFKMHPNLIKQYQKALELLELNPFHPSLRLHALKGNLLGLHSISMNIRYRIIIEFMLHDKKIIPINIGDHAEVYSF